MSFSLLLPPKHAISLIVLLFPDNFSLRTESLSNYCFDNAGEWDGNIIQLEAEWWLQSQSPSLSTTALFTSICCPFGGPVVCSM